MRRLALLFLMALGLACASTAPHEIASPGFYQDVSWSPDSKWIAYSRLRDHRWAVSVARADGSEERAVSDPQLDAMWTAWSPDGTRLALSAGSGKQSDIYLVSLRDPTKVTRLTNDGGRNSAPAWSRDGTQLAFVTVVEGKGRLNVIDLRTNVVRPIQTAATAENPQWSRDGKRIVFQSQREGKDVVCVIHQDGQDERVVTPADLQAIYPGWGKRGEIVFASWATGRDSEIMTTVGNGRPVELGQKGFFARVAPNGRAIAVVVGKYPSSRIVIRAYRH